MEIVTGTIINNRYKVLSKLGTGGMGTVYLVEDLELHSTKRALKLLHSHIAKELHQVERFRQEMTLACELSHPNIIRFFEFGETTDGQYFMTMEYFEGQNLGDIIDAPEGQGGLPFEEVLPILYYVAGALHHIHSKNIIHRDIKPSNILIGTDGTVKLTDLGIAKSLLSTNKITRTNEMVGTSSYMSPEQFTGLPIDHRTDIYSFGITAFELLTGKQPFDDENYVRLMAMHLSEPIPKLNALNKDLPSWLQRFIENCCAKKADERFETMAEVANELHRQIKKLGIEVKALDLSADKFDEAAIKRTKRGPLLRTISFMNRYWSRIRPVWRNGIIAILIGLLHLFLMTPISGYYYSGVLGQAINLKVMDLWFNWRGRIDPPKDVVIISIDEKSHEELGASMKEAWPRRLTAELLEKLAEHKPKKVFLDFRYGVHGEPIEDTRFAMSLSLSPTYLAEFVKIHDRIELDGRVTKIKENVRSLDFFTKSAAGQFNADLSIGHMQPGQSYGIVRTFRAFPEINEPHPQIAEILFDKTSMQNTLPTDRDFINFYGLPISIISVPIYKVIKEVDIPELYFKDKYVFVGRQLLLPYQSTQTDTFLTPFMKPTAGVEIHATIAANILRNDFIRRLTEEIEKSTSFIIATFLALVLITVHPKRGIFISAFLVMVLVSVAFIMFSYGWFLPTSAMALTAIVSYLICLLRFSFNLFLVETFLRK